MSLRQVVRWVPVVVVVGAVVALLVLGVVGLVTSAKANTLDSLGAQALDLDASRLCLAAPTARENPLDSRARLGLDLRSGLATTRELSLDLATLQLKDLGLILRAEPLTDRETLLLG